jgi:hypothetical protein
VRLFALGREIRDGAAVADPHPRLRKNRGWVTIVCWAVLDGGWSMVTVYTVGHHSRRLYYAAKERDRVQIRAVMAR